MVLVRVSIGAFEIEISQSKDYWCIVTSFNIAMYFFFYYYLSFLIRWYPNRIFCTWMNRVVIVQIFAPSMFKVELPLAFELPKYFVTTK